MQTSLDCDPCSLRQALSAARRAHADPAVQHRVLLATMARLSRADTATTPIELAADIHRLVREHTGHRDPYLAAKEDATRQAPYKLTIRTCLWPTLYCRRHRR